MDHAGNEVGRRVSVVITPRQRWSLAERSLQAVLEHMPTGAQLVYVDGGAPVETAERLRKLVEDIDGVWITRDCVLVGNEARNLAVEHADREFIVFIENDVIPGPEWIERLVECADETGAFLVGPLILHGSTEDSREIHIAGGELAVHDGVMDVNTRLFDYRDYSDVSEFIHRMPTDQLEFHAVMMRHSFVDSILPFDEEIRSLGDHEDIALAAQQQGVGTWFEPASEVTFLKMIRLEDEDLGYWQLRWSEDWNSRSMQRFCSKWNVDPAVGWPEIASRWGAEERTRWYHGRGKALKLLGKAFRSANQISPISRMQRPLEQKFISRSSGPEIARRRAVLGHD